MKMKPLISIIFCILILVSCQNSTQKSEVKSAEITQSITAELNPVDSNFNDFIEKFSTDSLFQLSRTKFPLKVIWYDFDLKKENMFCKEVSGFEMMDFRVKKSNNKTDNWEQKIVLLPNNQNARIEIHGIDNGILVYYLFEKIKGSWILTEISDQST